METEEEINDEHERQVKEQDTKLDQVQAETTEHQASPVELVGEENEPSFLHSQVEQLHNFLKSMRTQYIRLTNPKSGKGTRDTPYSERDQWILNTFRVLEGHIDIETDGHDDSSENDQTTQEADDPQQSMKLVPLTPTYQFSSSEQMRSEIYEGLLSPCHLPPQDRPGLHHLTPPSASHSVHKADKLPRGSSSEEDTEFYEPGKCYVLFINNLFTGGSDYREGAERDKENVQSLFKNLGGNFCLKYAHDVTKEQLENYLSDLQNTLGSGLYKSFILILESHGEPQSSRTGGPEKDGVLMADDSWMLVDDIIKNFHGDKIRKMRDRPKIFIIQSCRGKEPARPVTHSDAPVDLSAPRMLHNMEFCHFLTRPVNSDVLVAYATTEGTKAWRNSDEGSWFVHDLCDVITEFKDKEHILDILVRVNKKMVRRESTEGRAKQMPCFVCTFTKRFMFIPK
ncbi:caspase-3-like [Diadema antillarum]|uniref:caspase-3-like n=1 Tax=Diadema antillarum TaxID=105358 RepID=UPI003A8B04A5